MTKHAFLFGLLLVLLGVIAGAYFQAVTAFIPAFFGLALLLTGLIGQKERLRMHAMHLAALIALIGTLFPAYMVIKAIVTITTGGTLARPYAVTLQAAMAVLCAWFLALCIRSFIAARRARKTSSV